MQGDGKLVEAAPEEAGLQRGEEHRIQSWIPSEIKGPGNPGVPVVISAPQPSTH